MQIVGVDYGMSMPVPLLARPIRAGFPSPADDFVEEAIDLQRLLVANRAATFIVEVSGDSMIGKGLFDGDLAIVDRSLSPQNGDVVVATSTASARSRSGRVATGSRRCPFQMRATPPLRSTPRPSSRSGA